MIVLQILKIIGIVLACIVGLVILVVLLVCFAPIRYKITGKGDNSEIEATASAKWLLGLAKASIEYREKKATYRVRVAFFEIMKGVIGEDETETLKEALEEESVQNDPKQYEKISRELEKAEEKAEKAEALKEEKVREKEAEKEAKKTAKAEAKEKKKRENKLKSLKEKIRERIERLRALKEKIKEGKRIWDAKPTKRAIRVLKVEILNILNHIKPRKISGDLSFGLADPADTAILYGNILPITEALSKGKLLLTPEFYNKGIRFDLTIKGRIFIGYMLLCFVRVYFNRDVQRVAKAIRRYLNG